jgi:hypothetical protein
MIIESLAQELRFEYEGYEYEYELRLRVGGLISA